MTVTLDSWQKEESRGEKMTRKEGKERKSRLHENDCQDSGMNLWDKKRVKKREPEKKCCMSCEVLLMNISLLSLHENAFLLILDFSFVVFFDWNQNQESYAFMPLKGVSFNPHHSHRFHLSLVFFYLSLSSFILFISLAWASFWCDLMSSSVAQVLHPCLIIL